MPMIGEDSGSAREHPGAWFWPMGPALLLALLSFGVFFWIAALTGSSSVVSCLTTRPGFPRQCGPDAPHEDHPEAERIREEGRENTRVPGAPLHAPKRVQPPGEDDKVATPGPQPYRQNG